MTAYVVFTDLDGTLLDHHTYSWEPAEPALALLGQTRTPLVMVSSKTRQEIEALRARIHNTDPFIPENGGAVFIPRDSGLPVPAEAKADAGYHIIVLGLPIQRIAPVFDRLAQAFPLKAFSRMTADEIRAATGLSPSQAEAAGRREFGEAVVCLDENVNEEELAAQVNRLGLRLTKGGRFFHLLGDNDKGRAVAILSRLYRRVFPGLVTIGLGDAPNDAPMLAEVDRPYLLAAPDGSFRQVEVPGLVKVPLSGPAGFNRVILDSIPSGAPST